ALPQPQPAPWSPEDAQRGGRRADPPVQGTFVLHGLPRAAPEPSDGDPVPTPASDLPCPEALARSLVQAAMDVVRGHRPASQVLRWTTPEVYSQLRQRARLEQAQARPGARRPVVRSLRSSASGPRGVEVSAVVLDGPRARAVAARLDGEDGRWRLTALVIG
ncbi:Rv3235 family protein, partial [Aquipuribacter hungaricus]